MTRTFFHYTSMPMHMECMLPLFDELRSRGWKMCAQGQDRTVAFTTSGDLILADFVERSPLIWLPHGLSVAKWAWPRELGGKDAVPPQFLLLPGPFYEQRLRMGCASYLKPAIPYAVVGWPKADSYFNGSLVIPGDYERPVILFAPSWNYEGKATVGTFSYLEQVRERLGPLGGTLLVAPHPIDRKHPGDWVTTEGPINRWIMAADVVISDQSSVAMEAACVGKPAVHLFELYHERGWAPFDGEQFVVGHTATLDSLAGCVADAIEHPERFDFMRRYWREAMCAYPGEASRRAADAVEGFLERQGIA